MKTTSTLAVCPWPFSQAEEAEGSPIYCRPENLLRVLVRNKQTNKKRSSYHLDQSENINFSSYNHRIKSTLSFAKNINHDCREPSRKKTIYHLFYPKTKRLQTLLFPITNSFSSRVPPAVCLFPCWRVWPLSALQIKFLSHLYYPT